MLTKGEEQAKLQAEENEKVATAKKTAKRKYEARVEQEHLELRKTPSRDGRIW